MCHDYERQSTVNKDAKRHRLLTAYRYSSFWSDVILPDWYASLSEKSLKSSEVEYNAALWSTSQL